MRTAPAVSVPCTGGAAWRWFSRLLPAAAAAALAAGALGHAGIPAWPALGLLLVGAAWALRHPAAAPVALAWDGQRWSADDQAASMLEVMIDLGPWLLLRLRPAVGDRSRWIAVSAAEAGAAWHALRAAAYGQPLAPGARQGTADRPGQAL